MMMASPKVLVGMSGGVDSSVAAYLLKQQGFDVHGFSLKMWDEDGRCCSREDIEAAIAVSRKIGIPHTIIDIRAEFRQEVVEYFLSEYRNGRTPNPCAVCNQRIRFGSFWEQVDDFGADYLSTGHYTRNTRNTRTPSGHSHDKPEHTLRSQGHNTRIIEESGEFLLSRAQDNKKTQEYFLSLISKERLARIIFPLGDLIKDEVRRIAKDNDLPCIHRESQDVCFIPDGDTHSFLCKHLGQRPGDIVDLSGKVLGRHRGLWCHTIGQRKGLGIAAPQPLFVISLDIENNRIIVGPRSALAGDSFRLTQINRFTDRDLSGLPLTCKIRYATPEVPCCLDGDEVTLNHPVDAITPGQLGVIYWGDKVVLAGFIATQLV